MKDNVIPFPRTRALRVAHRWQPTAGEAAEYCGQPVRVITVGEANCQIERIHERGHVVRTWVGTAILKPWRGQLEEFERVMSGERVDISDFMNEEETPCA